MKSFFLCKDKSCLLCICQRRRLRRGKRCLTVLLEIVKLSMELRFSQQLMFVQLGSLEKKEWDRLIAGGFLVKLGPKAELS